MTDSPPAAGLTPSRVALVWLVACLAVGLAIAAGVWQYGRYEDRAQALSQYQRAADQPTVELPSLVDAGGTTLPADANWREVTATGTFADSGLVELRNRPIDGAAAVQYLSWFVTTEGDSLLVNLGWSAIATDQDSAERIVVPSSEVTATMTVREMEPDDGRRGDGATRITPSQMPPAPTGSIYPAYGMVQQVCTAGSCGEVEGLTPVPLPSLSLGTHLAYAWQWWVFAALVPVGAVALIRRDQAPKPHSPGDDGNRATSRRQSRPLSDEEIEDAL